MARVEREAPTQELDLLAHRIELLDVKKSYRYEQGFTLELYTTPDSQEARDAFVEKRDANF